MTPEEMRLKLKLQQQQQALKSANSGPPTITPELAQQAIENRVRKDKDLGTALNMAGEAMTFGLIGDEASAAVESLVPGVDYETRRDHYRNNEASLRERSPAAGFAADAVGGLAGAALPVGAAMQAGSVPARVAKSIGAGGVMGGLYGFSEGEGGLESRLDDAATGTAIGAGAGAVAPVVGSAVQKLANRVPRVAAVRAARQTAKTAEGQRAASGALYDQFQDAGAEISLPAFRRIAGGMNKAMGEIEPNPSMPGPLGKPSSGSRKIAKTLMAIDDDMSQFAGQNPGLPLQALDDVRKELGRLGQKVDPATFRPTRGAVSAQRATATLDDMIDNLRPEDIVDGDYETAISALKKARAAWRQSIKTQKVENAIDLSEDYLSGAESGLRNQIRTILRQNKKSNLFNKQEEGALRKIIGGSMLSRGARLVGDGIGRRMALFGGGAMGGAPGMAVGAAAGELASRIGDSAAMRKAEIAKALISSGALQNLPTASPQFQRIAAELTRRLGAVQSQ